MKFTKEFKAGIIAILAIASFWWLFNFLKGKDLFAGGNIYYVKFENVDGLSSSRPVSINGLKVGKIESIKPVKSANGNYEFTVKLVIKDEFSFSKNSIAEIYEPGLMAGKEIRLILANDNQTAQSGDEIKGRINSSITEMLSKEMMPLKNNINNVLLELDSTLNASQKLIDDGNIQQVHLLLTRLNGTVDNFRNTSQSLNGVVAKNDLKLSGLLDNANNLITSSNTTVQKYGTVADKINQLDLHKTIAKLENTLDNLNGTMTKISNGEGTLGKLMNDKELYDNLNASSKNLASLLEDLKKNPQNYVSISVFGRKNKVEEKNKELKK